MRLSFWLLWCAASCGSTTAFEVPPLSLSRRSTTTSCTTRTTPLSSWQRRHCSYMSSSSNNNNNQELLEQETFGGYTVKQRLREEVESPFRTVRLFFFGSSFGSAMVAFYFSLLTLLKSYAAMTTTSAGTATGLNTAVIPLDEAWQSVGINVAAAVVCAALTYRDWQAGQANLARIKQGGALAKLVVVEGQQEMLSKNNNNKMSRPIRRTLSDYRRNARVLIAAGGAAYITALFESLQNTPGLTAAVKESEIVVVPVLLQQLEPTVQVGDTMQCWNSVGGTSRPNDDDDKDASLMNQQQQQQQECSVVAFPKGPAAWADVLKPEVETAVGQGFNVLDKGITVILKKNGRILRRATGQPQWNGLVGAMEVLDGSKFGMPGDDEKYGTGKAPSA